MFVLQIDQDLSLQMIEQYHIPELYALVDRDRNHLREWLPWVDDITSPQVYEPIVRQWLRQLSQHKGFQTGIRYQQHLVGMVGFHEIDWPNRKVGLGYWLAKDYQGYGIMTRACKAMIAYAFNTYDLNRVEIEAAVGNTKSRAIPERLGFTYEGRTRDGEFLYDHYVDLIMYGMLKREWRT